MKQTIYNAIYFALLYIMFDFLFRKMFDFGFHCGINAKSKRLDNVKQKIQSDGNVLKYPFKKPENDSDPKTPAA